MKHILVLAALLLASAFGPAFAASVSSTLSTSDLTLDKAGSIVLTWTATGAGRCLATGDWSGSKVVTGGTETVPVSKTSTFTLTCDSPTGPSTLVWINPTKYSDGSALTIKDIQVMSGPNATALARLAVVPPTSPAAVQSPPGLTFFTVRVRDAAGVESADSASASKTVVADSSVSTVKVTLAIAPLPATGLTVQ